MSNEAPASLAELEQLARDIQLLERHLASLPMDDEEEGDEQAPRRVTIEHLESSAGAGHGVRGSVDAFSSAASDGNASMTTWPPQSPAHSVAASESGRAASADGSESANPLLEYQSFLNHFMQLAGGQSDDPTAAAALMQALMDSVAGGGDDQDGESDGAENGAPRAATAQTQAVGHVRSGDEEDEDEEGKVAALRQLRWMQQQHDAQLAEVQRAESELEELRQTRAQLEMLQSQLSQLQEEEEEEEEEEDGEYDDQITETDDDALTADGETDAGEDEDEDGEADEIDMEQLLQTELALETSKNQLMSDIVKLRSAMRVEDNPQLRALCTELENQLSDLQEVEVRVQALRETAEQAREMSRMASAEEQRHASAIEDAPRSPPPQRPQAPTPSRQRYRPSSESPSSGGRDPASRSVSALSQISDSVHDQLESSSAALSDLKLAMLYSRSLPAGEAREKFMAEFFGHFENVHKDGAAAQQQQQQQQQQRSERVAQQPRSYPDPSTLPRAAWIPPASSDDESDAGESDASVASSLAVWEQVGAEWDAFTQLNRKQPEYVYHVLRYLQTFATDDDRLKVLFFLDRLVTSAGLDDSQSVSASTESFTSTSTTASVASLMRRLRAGQAVAEETSADETEDEENATVTIDTPRAANFFVQNLTAPSPNASAASRSLAADKDNEQDDDAVLDAASSMQHEDAVKFAKDIVGRESILERMGQLLGEMKDVKDDDDRESADFTESDASIVSMGLIQLMQQADQPWDSVVHLAVQGLVILHTGKPFASVRESLLKSMSDLLYDEMIFHKVLAQVEESYGKEIESQSDQNAIEQLEVQRDRDVSKLHEERLTRLCGPDTLNALQTKLEGAPMQPDWYAKEYAEDEDEDDEEWTPEEEEEEEEEEEYEYESEGVYESDDAADAPQERPGTASLGQQITMDDLPNAPMTLAGDPDEGVAGFDPRTHPAFSSFLRDMARIEEQYGLKDDEE